MKKKKKHLLLDFDLSSNKKSILKNTVAVTPNRPINFPPYYQKTNQSQSQANVQAQSADFSLNSRQIMPETERLLVSRQPITQQPFQQIIRQVKPLEAKPAVKQNIQPKTQNLEQVEEKEPVLSGMEIGAKTGAPATMGALVYLSSFIIPTVFTGIAGIAANAVTLGLTGLMVLGGALIGPFLGAGLGFLLEKIGKGFSHLQKKLKNNTKNPNEAKKTKVKQPKPAFVPPPVSVFTISGLFSGAIGLAFRGFFLGLPGGPITAAIGAAIGFGVGAIVGLLGGYYGGKLFNWVFRKNKPAPPAMPQSMPVQRQKNINSVQNRPVENRKVIRPEDFKRK